MTVRHIVTFAALGWFLPAAIIAATPATPKQPVAPKEKLICKSFTQVGSLVARSRVCKTSREWEFNRALLRQQSGVNSCRQQPCQVGGK